jgi:hypothetical protein
VVDNGFEQVRNFFTFDLRTLIGTPQAAWLELFKHDGGDVSYSVFDVMTDAARLNLNDAFKADVFEDLGSGVLFGTYAIRSGAPSTLLSLRLDPPALAAIAAAQGGFFSVGGRINGRGIVFGGSEGSAVRLRVAIEPATPVPEPGTMLLIGGGLAAVVVRRSLDARRLRRQARRRSSLANAQRQLPVSPGA